MAVVRGVILCVIAIGCTSPLGGDLAVTAISPPMGPSDKTQDVTIDGIGFEPRLVSNLDDGSTTYDGALTVTIGNTALQNATRVDGSTITGTVPAGMVPGTYDVTVEMAGRVDTLEQVYTVGAGSVTTPMGTQIQVDPVVTEAITYYTGGATVLHFIGDNANRVLVVGLSISFSGTTATSVTCNGVALSRIVAADAPLSDGRVELWELVAPPSGIVLIETTLDRGDQSTMIMGSVSFSGVDQGAPNATVVSANGSTGIPAIDVSASTGDVAIGLVVWNGGDYSTLVPQQQPLWLYQISDQGNGSSIVGGASIGVGATQFQWPVADGSNRDFWSAAGISLQEGP